MMWLLQMLIMGHFHKWKTIENVALIQTEDSGRVVVGRGQRYIQQCETCGKVIKRDLV